MNSKFHLIGMISKKQELRFKISLGLSFVGIFSIMINNTTSNYFYIIL